MTENDVRSKAILEELQLFREFLMQRCVELRIELAITNFRNTE